MTEPLPGALAEIEELIGRDAAIAMARYVGGGRIYVPKGTDTATAAVLREMLGPEKAGRLLDRYAGDTLEIPKARKFVVPTMADAGMTRRQIVAETGLTAATVRQYLRGRNLP